MNNLNLTLKKRQIINQLMLGEKNLTQLTKKIKVSKPTMLKYLNELEKLMLSSPSPTGQGQGCLPYATQDNVDTGHGWRTPKGSTTGSVAATAYALFAQKGHNPLTLHDDE